MGRRPRRVWFPLLGGEIGDNRVEHRKAFRADPDAPARCIFDHAIGDEVRPSIALRPHVPVPSPSPATAGKCDR